MTIETDSDRPRAANAWGTFLKEERASYVLVTCTENMVLGRRGFPYLIGIVWGILSLGTPDSGLPASCRRRWTAGIATQQDMGPGGVQNANHESARWSVVKEGKASYVLLAALSILR